MSADCHQFVQICAFGCCRDRRGSPDKSSPGLRLPPPPPDRRLPPPPGAGVSAEQRRVSAGEQRRLPPPPPLDKAATDRTQQSVQDVFRDFIKQEKELLGRFTLVTQVLRFLLNPELSDIK